ncbi:MAG: hypothetical protein KUG78_14205 [Kangiellaceae bacterium]|nr:hypothetical protein [Kangiellaceae bacterium]
MTNESTIPRWFTVVAWVAFVWNLLGVMAFAAQMMMTPEMLATLPENERAMYENIPIWVNIAFACAVIGGALGSLLLALKKSIALYALIISVIGVCVQMYHNFFIVDSVAVYGPGSAVMPGMVLIIAFALVWLANHAKSKQWVS